MFLPYQLKAPNLTENTNTLVLRDGYLNAHFAWRRGRNLLTYLHALGLHVVLCRIAGHLTYVYEFVEWESTRPTMVSESLEYAKNNLSKGLDH